MYKLLVILLLGTQTILAQSLSLDLHSNWQFRRQGDTKWYKATVPGTIHTDLLNNKLIPDPYYRDKETKLQWIGETNWDYKTVFNVDPKLFAKHTISLVFDGLDTYADVYVNGHLLLQADNMFRGWTLSVKEFLHLKNNILLIHFRSAQKMADSLAESQKPLVLPDNPRVYVRKAQYHFGWDWGPKFVTCGIWKGIRLVGDHIERSKSSNDGSFGTVKLIRQKDSIGQSFYFEENGKPVYIKGANYIPADVFLPHLKKADYRKIIQSAKDAHMNMLRVWGGGVYESDDFYDLCDEYGIMVWQDFMFAGGMIPGDEHFFNNAKEEVKYQVNRLKYHPCIVLWCGNNEIDEAWNNWGWQDQFNLHGSDSALVWNNYRRLFIDSLPKWVNEYDGRRPYISSSPMHGWGHDESFKEGDSHYWGVWWGMEPVEIFEHKTGRFVSEYGMQAMPDISTMNDITINADRYLYSPVLKAHQKATDGFEKIKAYLQLYFLDSSKVDKLDLEDYTYLTQCVQYYCLKNIIAIQRSKAPLNMGTLLWQLNDCWPVCSWSITDYLLQPKAGYFAVKEAYRDDKLPERDAVYPRNLALQKPVFKVSLTGDELFISSDVPAKYVYISYPGKQIELADNYFDLRPGIPYRIRLGKATLLPNTLSGIKIRSLYDIVSQ